MAIVHIPAALRPLAGGATDATVAGSTLGEVVESLEDIYPGIKDRLIQVDRIRPGMAVFVDGVTVSPLLTTRIPENAEIFFAPAIAGG